MLIVIEFGWMHHAVLAVICDTLRAQPSDNCHKIAIKAVMLERKQGILVHLACQFIK